MRTKTGGSSCQPHSISWCSAYAAVPDKATKVVSLDTLTLPDGGPHSSEPQHSSGWPGLSWHVENKRRHWKCCKGLDTPQKINMACSSSNWRKRRSGKQEEKQVSSCIPWAIEESAYNARMKIEFYSVTHSSTALEKGRFAAVVTEEAWSTKLLAQSGSQVSCRAGTERWSTGI